MTLDADNGVLSISRKITAALLVGLVSVLVIFSFAENFPRYSQEYGYACPVCLSLYGGVVGISLAILATILMFFKKKSSLHLFLLSSASFFFGMVFLLIDEGFTGDGWPLFLFFSGCPAAAALLVALPVSKKTPIDVEKTLAKMMRWHTVTWSSVIVGYLSRLFAERIPRLLEYPIDPALLEILSVVLTALPVMVLLITIISLISLFTTIGYMYRVARNVLGVGYALKHIILALLVPVVGFIVIPILVRSEITDLLRRKGSHSPPHP